MSSDKTKVWSDGQDRGATSEDMMAALGDEQDLQVMDHVTRRGMVMTSNCKHCGRQWKAVSPWGEIAMMFSDYVSLQPHLASGKVKIIAVTGLRRSRLTPQVPTMAELGYTGFEAVGWGGVFAPAKTPPHIVQQLAAAVTAAVRDPAVSAKLGEMGYEPGGVPTAEFASQVKSDHALWTGLIRRAGARLD